MGENRFVEVEDTAGITQIISIAEITRVRKSGANWQVLFRDGTNIILVTAEARKLRKRLHGLGPA